MADELYKYFNCENKIINYIIDTSMYIYRVFEKYETFFTY